MNLSISHTQQKSLSQITEIEPYIIKIQFEGNVDRYDIQDIRNHIELGLQTSNEQTIYFLIDLFQFNSIDLEARLCVLDKLKSTGKSVYIILFGLAEDKNNIIQYIRNKAPYIPLYLNNSEAEALQKARDLYSMNKISSLTVGPSVFTGISKEKVMVSGKQMTLVHDKKWCYSHADDTYFYRIDLIDSDILISRPSGFLDYGKILITNVLFDKVVNRVMGPNNHYYQIVDYTNVLNTTLRVKRNLVNGIDRSKLIVFYGLTNYMKFVLSYLTHVNPKLHQVRIAESYEDAIRIVLEDKYGNDYLEFETVGQQEAIYS